MKIYRTTIIENSPVALLNRVLTESGDNATADDFESITATITDRVTGTQIGVLDLDPATAVYDELQTDAKWTRDNDGYNFIARISGDYFPEGDRTYRVEILFSPTDAAYGGSSPFLVLWDLQCINVLSR